MKDKTLAVSKRDRQLLSIMLAFVIVFLAYFFIAGPAFDKGTTLLSDRQFEMTNLERTKAVIEQAPQVERDLTAKSAELTEKYQVFLYKIDEARILTQLDVLLAQSALAVNSYRQSGSTVDVVRMPISEFSAQTYELLNLASALNPTLVEPPVEGNNIPEDQKQSGTETAVANTVSQMDIGIGYANASYDAIYNFLTALEGLDRSFILSDIVIGKDTQVAGLQGQIVLRAISLPKIDEAEAADLQFTPLVPKGKASPF